jgi:hypothetical protein
MILHLLQIFFTLGLTFIVVSSGAGAVPRRMRVVFSGNRGGVRRRDPLLAGPLLVAVDDPPAGQVVGAQFHHDPVVGQDPDVVHPHLPADMGQDLVPVVKLHSEEGIRE